GMPEQPFVEAAANDVKRAYLILRCPIPFADLQWVKLPLRSSTRQSDQHSLFGRLLWFLRELNAAAVSAFIDDHSCQPQSKVECDRCMACLVMHQIIELASHPQRSPIGLRS